MRAAQRIRAGLADLHLSMPERFRLHFGIGIHSGEALLGLVGTQKRLEYTAVGDSVNTAKRLQEVAREGQILISKATAAHLPDPFQAGPFRMLNLEGKEQPIAVCELYSYEADSSSA